MERCPFGVHYVVIKTMHNELKRTLQGEAVREESRTLQDINLYERSGDRAHRIVSMPRSDRRCGSLTLQHRTATPRTANITSRISCATRTSKPFPLAYYYTLTKGDP